jgi:uncharacterized protein YgiM (DUF1202 family)
MTAHRCWPALRHAAALLPLLLALLAGPAAAGAGAPAAGELAAVAVDALNLREAPGLDAGIVAVLPAGTPLAVVDAAAAADGEAWVPVAVVDGDFAGWTGWVAGTYLASEAVALPAADEP